MLLGDGDRMDEECFVFLHMFLEEVCVEIQWMENASHPYKYFGGNRGVVDGECSPLPLPMWLQSSLNP
jgi:hypothetical protein